jgi:hypothetical protein
VLDRDAPDGIRHGTMWAWTNARWVAFFYCPPSGSSTLRRPRGSFSTTETSRRPITDESASSAGSHRARRQATCVPSQGCSLHRARMAAGQAPRALARPRMLVIHPELYVGDPDAFTDGVARSRAEGDTSPSECSSGSGRKIACYQSSARAARTRSIPSDTDPIERPRVAVQSNHY